MNARQITNLQKLSQYQQRWDELAGESVFRSWAWLSTWWKHYGENSATHELFVLLIFDEVESTDCQTNNQKQGCCTNERLIAILPCYLETSLTRGCVLRLLGDGEVCSEYLGILVDSANEPHAAELFAEYLDENSDHWDLADFSAIGKQCPGLEELLSCLQSHDCHVTSKPGPNCWSIDLPSTWDDFLAKQSKSHRKQLRQLERRVLETKQATWHIAESQSDFEMAWSILIDLHQRRRNSLGEPGCFASDTWAAFHRDIARQLRAAGQLRLSWLEKEGQPIAAEYHIARTNTTFAYQGGLDPDRLNEEPGRLSLILSVKHAIAEGHTHFDLLRGDEPYKPHWRATPEPTADYQVVPTRAAARWRYQAWSTMHRAGRLARQFASLLS